MTFGIIQKDGRKLMQILNIFDIIGIPATIYATIDLIIKSYKFACRTRAKSIIWGKKKEWVIVVPRYENKYRREEDILASELIQKHCSKYGYSCLIQDDSQTISTDKNLIFICGSKSNKATEQYFNSFHHSIDIAADMSSIVDKSVKSNYTSKYENGILKKDFAILMRYLDPVTDSTYIFCAGIHGLGTLGAAKMLTEYKLIKYLKAHDSFESIIEVTSLKDSRTLGPITFIIPPRILK